MFLIAVVGLEDKVTVDATVGIASVSTSVRGITGIGILLPSSLQSSCLLFTINCEVFVNNSVKLDWTITGCSVEKARLHQKWDSP